MYLDISMGINSMTTQQCNQHAPPIFMQLTDQSNGETTSSAFLLARKDNWLARTYTMNMRNATCAGTQTSEAPTQVAFNLIYFLFIFIL